MSQINTINTNKVVFFLLCGWLVLWSANAIQDIAIWMTGTSEKFWILDLDSEDSLYTWFSTVILSFAALLAFLLSAYRADAGRNIQSQWKVIGVIFLLLSTDEMLSFHERLSSLLRGALSTSGIFEFAWVIPALIVVPALGFMFLPFLRSLPSHVSRLIVVAGAIFVLGAVGIEMLAGLFISESSIRDEAFLSPIYRLLVSTEEGLEALGVIIFIKALLMQAEIYFPSLFRTTGAPARMPVARPAN